AGLAWGACTGSEADRPPDAGDSAGSDASPPPDAGLATPSGLTCMATSASSVRLHWIDNSGNETAFQVQRAPSAAGPFAEVTLTPANATSFDDVGLQAATTYYYRVRAANSADYSGF